MDSQVGYQDRADVWGAQREEEMASREEAGESPTSSQIAKKRLGFENLFDKTDPDVQEIDDVVDMGLLSGRSVEAEICHILAILSALRTVINIFRFLAQKPAEVEKEVIRQTQADFNSSSRPQYFLKTLSFNMYCCNLYLISDPGPSGAPLYSEPAGLDRGRSPPSTPLSSIPSRPYNSSSTALHLDPAGPGVIE